jgi:hypothetical protein
MGANLSVTSPTDEQFNGVSQICLRNDNTGLIMELHLDEDRDGKWRDCDTALNIPVRQTKCVDFRKCQRNHENRGDYRVTLYQAAANGDREVYERKFKYSEFGKIVDFQITGSTIGNAKGSVTGTRKRSPPSDKCLGDSCYVAPDRWINFDQARNYCEDRDGHLAYIESEEENAVVQHTLNDSWDTAAWLGLYWETYNQQNENGFTAWLNGDNLEYTNWAPGEPNYVTAEIAQSSPFQDVYRNVNEAGEMLANGSWNTHDSKNDNHFICEIPKDKIANYLYN